MKNMRYLFGTARLNFLILTPVCVFLGVAVAVRAGAPVDWTDVATILIGALAAHASVNLLNEYSDFKSGLDQMTERTPFSGGSGTLPNHPEAAALTLNAGILTLGLAAGVGIYFLVERGLALLPLGLAGLIVVATYTLWLTRHPLLCLLAPGLGFGPLMVLGTDFALSGTYTWMAFTASLTPFFLVSGLLLLNQFPDVDADRRAGRRHLPIVFGRQWASRVFAVIVLAAFIPVAVAIIGGLFPVSAVIALAGLPAALFIAVQVNRYADDISKLIPLMGLNVLMILVTITLLAVGLIAG